MDSDGDGASNGDELGDPCCTWVPGVVPPYRVWNLTHPGEKQSNLTAQQIRELSPPSCNEPVTSSFREHQFEQNYFMLHTSDLISKDANRLLKYPFALIIIVLLLDWSVRKGLMQDLFGVGPVAWSEATNMSPKNRCVIYVAAYLWTDMMAGLTHLTFDFCPHHYPIVGNVAKGFQFHHVHPTAWTVVPIFTMLSHSFLLLGTISVLLMLAPPRRDFRAFWALAFVFCLMTVLTHRWVHYPPEENFLWFRLLQYFRILMPHEHHKLHHDSLVTQFSNFSGVTDPLLDAISTYLIPPTSYQLWLSVLVVWVSMPIAAGVDWQPVSLSKRYGGILSFHAKLTDV
jgi:hypothetical protein